MNTQLINMAFPYNVRNKTLTFNDALKFLWQQDLINVGELAEKAIVKKSKKLVKKKKNAKGSDFKDGSDSKYCTVFYDSTNYATVSGLKNKTGKLRVMVYEPKTQKNYFFIIPHNVYRPYQHTGDSLKIYFTKDGQPRKTQRETNTRPNLWLHECSAKEWAK
jgi:hypothetical protein